MKYTLTHWSVSRRPRTGKILVILRGVHSSGLIGGSSRTETYQFPLTSVEKEDNKSLVKMAISKSEHDWHIPWVLRTSFK